VELTEGLDPGRRPGERITGGEHGRLNARRDSLGIAPGGRLDLEGGAGLRPPGGSPSCPRSRPVAGLFKQPVPDQRALQYSRGLFGLL
jgi:hypothetical protein